MRPEPLAVRVLTLGMTVIIALWFGCTNDGEAVVHEPCNGHSVLCTRTVDRVSFVTAHNAMATDEYQFLAPNQIDGITAQLASGVRGFMLDVYLEDDELLFCHAYCQFGSIPASVVLDEFRMFLEANPREVVILFFESYVTASDVSAGFQAAGLTEYLVVQAPEKKWPTLLALVESGRRLIVFTDDDAREPVWYHHVWDFAWETHWSAATVEDLSCEVNRGSTDNALFILNHFLTDPFASRSLAEVANMNPYFFNRAMTCQEESGRQPNFVAIDFTSIGDVQQVVDTLNGVNSPR
jgi:hypothetical protein